MKNLYEVLVSNVGYTYQGHNFRAALILFNYYKRQSQRGRGRGGNQDVLLIRNNDVIREHRVTEGDRDDL